MLDKHENAFPSRAWEPGTRDRVEIAIPFTEKMRGLVGADPYPRLPSGGGYELAAGNRGSAEVAVK